MFLEDKKQGELPVTTIEPWRRLLLATADEMETRGHSKRIISSASGVCYLGAKSFAFEKLCTTDKAWSRDDVAWDQVTRKLREYIGRNPVLWNDDPRTTGEEMVATMRKCAREAI